MCSEHVEKKGIQDGMQMRASIEGRNPVLQGRAMTSREGAIGRDEINATGKSGVEWSGQSCSSAKRTLMDRKAMFVGRREFPFVVSESISEKDGSLYLSQGDDDVWGEGGGGGGGGGRTEYN